MWWQWIIDHLLTLYIVAIHVRRLTEWPTGDVIAFAIVWPISMPISTVYTAAKGFKR